MSFSLHKIILSPDYRPDEKPPGSPLVIQASLNLRNIISIDEIHQQISLETTLRLYWKVSIIFLKWHIFSVAATGLRGGGWFQSIEAIYVRTLHAKGQA